jgi:hypothetical protein
VRRRWIDRGLVAAAVLLVAGVAADSLLSRGGGPARGQTPTAPTASSPTLTQTLKFSATLTCTSGCVQRDGIRVVPRGSALALELGTCAYSRLSIGVRPGPVLAVHNQGRACRLPELDLDAAVRDIHGQFVHRVRALLDGALPTTIAGGQTLRTPLAPGLLRCWSGRPLGLRASDQGRVIAGTIRCRVQR